MILLYSFLFLLKWRYERKGKNSMSEKRILIIAFNNMEDVEFTTPFDIWQRRGIAVEFASINDEEFIKTKYNLRISNPKKMSELDLNKYDAIFLPGGAGVNQELNNKKLDPVLEHFATNQKLLVAICAAPQFLSVRGYLRDKNAIAFNDEEIYKNLEANGAKVERNCENNQACEVVVDENIVTGMNYLSAVKLAETVANLLKGE